MAIDDSSAASRAAGLVTVQLGVELKQRWIQRCCERGLVPGKALRGLVEEAVSRNEGGGIASARKAIKVRVGMQADAGPKVGREVQFTASENAALEAAAKSQGFAVQEWLVAAARGAVAQAPAYGQSELEALTQSNARMAAIAVDLAAVRRQLGEGGDGVAAQISALEAEIRRHVERVSAVMAQGVQRWQLRI